MKRFDFLPDDFYEHSLEKREQLLSAAADEIKEETIHKPLSEDERLALKDTLADVSVELSIQQKKYDEVKDYWNNEILKPLKEQRKEAVEKIKTGTEEMESKVYYVRDQEAGKAIKFAPDGTELETRPLRADERKQTLNSNIRNINDGS